MHDQVIFSQWVQVTFFILCAGLISISLFRSFRLLFAHLHTMRQAWVQSPREPQKERQKGRQKFGRMAAEQYRKACRSSAGGAGEGDCAPLSRPDQVRRISRVFG